MVPIRRARLPSHTKNRKNDEPSSKSHPPTANPIHQSSSYKINHYIGSTIRTLHDIPKKRPPTTYPDTNTQNNQKYPITAALSQLCTLRKRPSQTLSNAHIRDANKPFQRPPPNT
jgi:hypothetical protein